ncbi:hypothetical protein KUTeg_016599 [Tegillarca granosa]|uniref:UBA domain-containing protein n=1 Tax=Tegillarca granosa TaxID=220873 RepID=A0ABQ9ELE1_TEGGR|nr:hypothetical protein KUTeg_016599 [Tegillarca granosa]
MEVDEGNVQTLLSMGFPSEVEVRRALRLAKNDLNDAVAYLTNDHPTSSYDTLDDVEMKEIHSSRSTQPVYGPSLPPSYDEAILPEKQDTTSDNNSEGAEMREELNPLEFPVTNLYELEGRVFAEHWSIPYKKEESLGKCLLAATRLAEANIADSDEHCTRFMERCMPESFQKLMTSAAVHRWSTDIQEGIFNMLQLFIDLVVARLQHQPVPVTLLDVLTMSMAALLRPLGMCAEFLNSNTVQEILAPGMERCIKYVQNLEEKDFKEKKVGSVSDLLASMKLICRQMWPQHIDSLDDLRLDIALRMLKSPHFNAKMNSLKEVTKLIEDATTSKMPKTAIEVKKISEWLVENKVLSIALEGNIDQAQYCDKIKGIVDFLGSELSLDELTMIWKMQVCPGLVIVKV